MQENELSSSLLTDGIPLIGSGQSICSIVKPEYTEPAGGVGELRVALPNLHQNKPTWYLSFFMMHLLG